MNEAQCIEANTPSNKQFIEASKRADWVEENTFDSLTFTFSDGSELTMSIS